MKGITSDGRSSCVAKPRFPRSSEPQTRPRSGSRQVQVRSRALNLTRRQPQLSIPTLHPYSIRHASRKTEGCCQRAAQLYVFSAYNSSSAPSRPPSVIRRASVPPVSSAHSPLLLSPAHPKRRTAPGCPLVPSIRVYPDARLLCSLAPWQAMSLVCARVPPRHSSAPTTPPKFAKWRAGLRANRRVA